MQEKQHRPVRRPDNTGNPERTASLSRKILPILLIPCAVWFIHAVETGELAQHVQSLKARIASGGESINSDRAPRRVAPKSGLDRKALEELFDRGLECYARDKRGAADWFRKAAEQGHAEAQYRIADMYAEGVGVGFSIKLAQDWFRLAAGQGNAAAQNYLGIMYCNGYGVAEDRHEAARWFRKAASQGQRNALAAMRQAEIAEANEENATSDTQTR